MFLSYGPCTKCQEKILPRRHPKVQQPWSCRLATSRRGPSEIPRQNARALLDYFAVEHRPAPETNMNPKPTLMAELIAEFLGTFVLILLRHRRRRHGRAVPLDETRARPFTAASPTSRWAGDSPSPWEFMLPEKFPARISIPPSRWRSPCFADFPWRKVRPVFHRANCRSIRRRRPGLLELSPGFPAGRSATRSHRRRLHNFPAFPGISAGRFSRSIHRHRLCSFF